MAIKTIVNEDNASRKERWEICLTINGYIVCQRYFRLYRFKPQSLNSVELADAFESCVNIIDRELVSKSLKYLSGTAPQVFTDESEMNKWLAANPTKLDPVTYIVLRNSEQVYVWNGEKPKPYDKYFNRADYVGGEETTPCELKFTLYDNGINLDEHVEIMSKVWDGNVYPRFIRNNIDLTNSKNRYKNPENFSAYEASLVDYLNEGRKEIVSRLIKEIEGVCTYEGEEKPSYTNKMKFTNPDGSKTTYWLNVKYQEELRIKSIEEQCKRKTDAYFNEK